MQEGSTVGVLEETTWPPNLGLTLQAEVDFMIIINIAKPESNKNVLGGVVSGIAFSSRPRVL